MGNLGRQLLSVFNPTETTLCVNTYLQPGMHKREGNVTLHAERWPHARSAKRSFHRYRARALYGPVLRLGMAHYGISARQFDFLSYHARNKR